MKICVISISPHHITVPLQKLPQPPALGFLRAEVGPGGEPLAGAGQRVGFGRVHARERGCELGAEGVVVVAAGASEAEELADDALAGFFLVEVEHLEGGAGDLVEAVADRDAAPGLGDVPLAEQVVVYQADVRYAGQAFQLTIDFSEEELAEKGLPLLIDQFDAEHKQLFTFALEEGHEIVMVRAIVMASTESIADVHIGREGTRLEDCKIQDTRFYYDGQYHDAVIYDRNQLHHGLVVNGPAIISEMDSTTVVLPGYVASIDVVGNLLINPVQ